MADQNTPRSEAELLTNASGLAGKTLGQLADYLDETVPDNLTHAKGWVGELIELALGAEAGSRPVPDFETLGIELKTIPLNARLQPQESTFVSSAPLANTVGMQWETSAVKAKLSKVLWIPVEAAKDLPIAKRRIGSAFLWSPSYEDEHILRADWEEHIERIAFGRLDELDARHGTYLQIRPKALNRRELTAATNGAGAPSLTLPRGFYLRTSFTRKILLR
ncbi:MAG: DNA mismatch repair endonuclease MutH [Proteobacteria bacterium]|nr:DNA mismatch repair endonuclease MutH [Pseudomonadota bacterium]